MIKTISIDPSGTGTTGICLIWGNTKIFFEKKSKIWQEHYEYLLELIQQEKPNLVLIETAFYENKRNKDIMDLEKLVGALECLKYHTKSQFVMRQNKLTKDWGEKLRQEIKTIPNLFYQGEKWIYYDDQEAERGKGGAKIKASEVNGRNGRSISDQNQGWEKNQTPRGESRANFQELSQHQVDALIIWHLYTKAHPYLGASSRISRNNNMR